MKIQIKSFLSASILFECDSDSMKFAVELAVKQRADLQGAYLQGVDLRGEKLDKAPLMIQGLKWDILITKQQIYIGCQQHKAEEWFKFTDEEIVEMHNEALVWWKAHKEFIKSA